MGFFGKQSQKLTETRANSLWETKFVQIIVSPLGKKKYLKMTALNKIFQKLPEPAATLLSTNEFFSESFWNIEFLVFLSYNRRLPFCMKRAIKQKIA